MSVAARLGAFAVVLVVAFVASYALGGAVGGADVDDAPGVSTTSTIHGSEHGG